MFCTNCGTSLPANARFCSKCGSPVLDTQPMAPVAPTGMPVTQLAPPYPQGQDTAPGAYPVVPVEAPATVQAVAAHTLAEVPATAAVPVADRGTGTPSPDGTASETAGERAVHDGSEPASGPALMDRPVARDLKAMPADTDGFLAEGAAPPKSPITETAVTNGPDPTVTGSVRAEAQYAGEAVKRIAVDARESDAREGQEEPAVARSDGAGSQKELEEAGANGGTKLSSALAGAMSEDLASGTRCPTGDESVRVSMEVAALRKSVKKMQQLLLSSGAVTPAQYCRIMYGSPSSQSATDSNPPQMTVAEQAAYDQTQILTEPKTQEASVYRASPARADLGKSKVVAGLLAIFLGGLGVHKFYLGYTGAGVAMLLISIFGAVIIVGPILMALCGLIEGIVYLVKSDEDFQSTYVWGNKPWF